VFTKIRLGQKIIVIYEGRKIGRRQYEIKIGPLNGLLLIEIGRRARGCFLLVVVAVAGLGLAIRWGRYSSRNERKHANINIVVHSSLLYP